MSNKNDPGQPNEAAADIERPSAGVGGRGGFVQEPSRLVVTSLEALSKKHGVLRLPDAAPGALALRAPKSLPTRTAASELLDSAINLYIEPEPLTEDDPRAVPVPESTFDTHALREGQVFTADHGAQYMVLKELGRGNMGVVVQAQRLGHAPCDVAIKFLHAGQTIESLVQEYSAARLLNGHLNIADINVIDTVDGVPFGEFEFIRGEDLEAIRTLHRRGPVQFCVSELLVAWVGWQVCEALAIAHHINTGGRRTGILHKDLKPNNIMIDHNGVVKVLDFGLAQDIEHVRREITAGRVTGTPVIIPSELLMKPPVFARIIGRLYGEVEVDPASLIDGRGDIFSLACTMYYMLTGFYPSMPDGDINSYANPLEEINRMHLRPLNPPHFLVEGLSPVLSMIIYLGAHPDPRLRPTARDFMRWLTGFLFPDTLGRGVFLRDIREYIDVVKHRFNPMSEESKVLKARFEKAARVIHEAPQSFPFFDEVEQRCVEAREMDLTRLGQRASRRSWSRSRKSRLLTRSGPFPGDVFTPLVYTPIVIEAQKQLRNPARYQITS